MALHGDGCPICQSVEKELIKLSRDLNCSLQVGEKFWKSVARCQPLDHRTTQVKWERRRKIHLNCFYIQSCFYCCYTFKVATENRKRAEMWSKNVGWCLRRQLINSLCRLLCRTRSPAAEWRTTVKARSSTPPHPPSCYRYTVLSVQVCSCKTSQSSSRISADLKILEMISAAYGTVGPCFLHFYAAFFSVASLQCQFVTLVCVHQSVCTNFFYASLSSFRISVK